MDLEEERERVEVPRPTTVEEAAKQVCVAISDGLSLPQLFSSIFEDLADIRVREDASIRVILRASSGWTSLGLMWII